MKQTAVVITGLVLIAIYLWWKRGYTKGEIRQVSLEEKTITNLIDFNLNKILNHLGIYKNFQVRLHRKKTYTLDNKTIYLKPGCNGEIYDINTLMKTGIHELAHVLTLSMYSNRMHDSEFIKTEQIIEDAAIYLNLYDPNEVFLYEDSCKY